MLKHQIVLLTFASLLLYHRYFWGDFHVGYQKVKFVPIRAWKSQLGAYVAVTNVELYVAVGNAEIMLLLTCLLLVPQNHQRKTFKCWQKLRPKAFTKPFEAPQRSVKIKIWLNFFYLRPDWDGKG